jgi:diguanylate cyclase (GGDEF)-like protein
MNQKPAYEVLERRVSELEQENKVLREQAVRDGATGLYNRQLNINDILNESSQEHEDIGVVFIDINRLKYLNDNFGHAEGDRVINDLARIITSSTKSSDYVIRQGGDEILVLLSNANGSTGKSVIDRVNSKIGRYNEKNRLVGNDKEGNQISYDLSISAGYVLRSYTSAEPIEETIQRADDLMYENKTGKKPEKKR